MEKEFVPYGLSLELEKLGFDEECFGYYVNTELDLTWKFSDCSLYQNIHNSTLAPLYQQAFRWFREKYKLSCSIELTDNSRHYYYDFTIYDSKNRDYNDEDCFDSCKRIYDDGKFGKYEEAELECLKKLIEIVKNK